MGAHDIDDQIEAGQRHGLAVCEAREAEHGALEAQAFAAGMASSLFVFIMLSNSREAALKLFTGIIDDLEILALERDSVESVH